MRLRDGKSIWRPPSGKFSSSDHAWIEELYQNAGALHSFNLSKLTKNSLTSADEQHPPGGVSGGFFGARASPLHVGAAKVVVQSNAGSDGALLLNRVPKRKGLHYLVRTIVAAEKPAITWRSTARATFSNAIRVETPKPSWRWQIWWRESPTWPILVRRPFRRRIITRLRGDSICEDIRLVPRTRGRRCKRNFRRMTVCPAALFCLSPHRISLRDPIVLVAGVLVPKPVLRTTARTTSTHIYPQDRGSVRPPTGESLGSGFFLRLFMRIQYAIRFNSLFD